MKNKNIINSLQNTIKNISLAIGCVFLVNILFSLFLQVVLRFLFSTGVPWAVEISRYSVIWAVLITSNVLIMDDELIKVNLFDALWHKKLLKYRDIIYNVIFIFIYITFIREGWLQSLAAMAKILPGLASVGVSVEVFYVYICVPIGATLMLIQTIISIYSDLINSN